MKILFSSDIHGKMPIYQKFVNLLRSSDFELGIIAGDLLAPAIGLADEIKNLLHTAQKNILFIMGNDDGIPGFGAEWQDKKNLVNINQIRLDYEMFNFVGYQYTVPFIGGKYEKTEKEIEKDLYRLAEYIDSETILVTHGPAYGTLDLTFDLQHCGSKALQKAVQSNPPKLHLFGHIHESFGVSKMSVNGAFPMAGKFVSIDLKMGEISTINIRL